MHCMYLVLVTVDDVTTVHETLRAGVSRTTSVYEASTLPAGVSLYAPRPGKHSSRPSQFPMGVLEPGNYADFGWYRSLWLRRAVVAFVTLTCIFIGTVHILCGAGSVHLSESVYRSVQAWAHSSKPTGLLLWSWPAWDFSWLLHDAQQCGMRQVNAVPCQCTKEAELRLVIVVSLTLHVSVPLLACFVTPLLLRYFCIFVSTVLSVCRRCFYLFGELIFSSFCLVHLSPGLMKKLWVNFCQATTVMFYLVL